VTLLDTPSKASTAANPELLFREAKQRRRRRWFSAGVVLVVATALAVGVAVSVGPKDGLPSPASLTTGAGRFIPPTTTRGDVTTMQLRLPDGRGFALSYPKSLDLSQSTITAGSQVDWAAQTGPLQCCGEYVAPYYGSVSSIFYGKPLAVYRGAHGQVVPYYAGTQERFPLLYSNMDYLAFRFGPWVVLVGDMVHSSYWTARMTNSQRATWARSFDAHIATGGYLVYRPHSPLTVSRGPIDIVLSHVGGSLEISGPVGCTASLVSPTVNAGITSWCDPRSEVRVAATGTTAFTQAVASGLRITTLRPIS
jgi:hypothetical protein